MRNYKKLFGITAALTALITGAALAATIGDDTVKISKPGSTANKTIRMGNGRVVWNQSTSKLTFSNDGGSNFKNFGSGGGGGGGINILQDFNFDFEGGTANWTASGGAFTAASAGSNLIFDAQSGVFNSSAGSQTLSSTLVTIPEGFKSANGAAGCYFKTAASDYKLQVFDGTNVLAERAIPVIAGAPQKIAATFIFPSSGSVRLRVISASDAADLAIDNCFLGENALVQLSQAEHYGSMSVTNCTGVTVWSTAGYNDQSAGGTACTYNATGKLSAPSGAFIGFRSALPKGEYLITIGGANSVSSGGVILGTRISNGTVHTKSPTKQLSGGGAAQSPNAGDTYALTVSAALAASDFRFQVNPSSGNYSSDVSGSNEFTFDVYRFPDSSEQALDAATVAQAWSGNVTGTTATTSAVLADLPGSPSLTEYSNTNMGTVSLSAASNGISLVPAKMGTIEVCASGTGYHSAANSTMGLAIYKNGALVDTAIGITQGTAGGSESFHRCVYPKVTSVGAALEFKLQASIDSGNFSVADVTWSFKYVDQQSPAPVIANAVVSPSAGVEVETRAFISGGSGASCTSDPCTIESQSGSWVTAANRTSAGVYTLTLAAGTFSTIPTCVITSNTSGALVWGYSPSSPTSLGALGYAFPVAATDGAFWIKCSGTK